MPGKKHVVGADGEVSILDLTPADESLFQDMEQQHLQEVAARNAENTRLETFANDATRIEFLDRLKAATAAEIEAFVRGRLNADGVTDLASQKEFNRRVENALAAMLKLLVKSVRD